MSDIQKSNENLKKENIDSVLVCEGIIKNERSEEEESENYECNLNFHELCEV